MDGIGWVQMTSSQLIISKHSQLGLLGAWFWCWDCWAGMIVGIIHLNKLHHFIWLQRGRQALHEHLGPLDKGLLCVSQPRGPHIIF